MGIRGQFGGLVSRMFGLEEDLRDDAVSLQCHSLAVRQILFRIR